MEGGAAPGPNDWRAGGGAQEGPLPFPKAPAFGVGVGDGGGRGWKQGKEKVWLHLRNLEMRPRNPLLSLI